jgi:hypothetical protein
MILISSKTPEEMTPDEAKEELKSIKSKLRYSGPIIDKLLDGIDKNPEVIKVGISDFYDTGKKTRDDKPYLEPLDEVRLSVLFDPINGAKVYVCGLVKTASNGNYEYSNISCPFDAFVLVRKDCLKKYKSEL